jgi:hypothetical protein
MAQSRATHFVFMVSASSASANYNSYCLLKQTNKKHTPLIRKKEKYQILTDIFFLWKHSSWLPIYNNETPKTWLSYNILTGNW